MDKLSPEGPCPPAEFLCVSWMLEKGDQSDGVSADTGEEFSQSHRLRTTKSPHLTDEETEAPKEATPPLWSASQSGWSQVQNPGLWISSPHLAPALHWTPSSLPRRLRENSLSFVLIGGSSTCPLLGLGDAQSCPLLELVGARPAFVWIGQFSVTPQAKGGTRVVRGQWERKLGENWGSRREGAPSGLDAAMADGARGSLPGILCPHTSWPCPALPTAGVGGVEYKNPSWEGPHHTWPSKLTHRPLSPDLKATSPLASTQGGNSSNSKAQEVWAQRGAEWLPREKRINGEQLRMGRGTSPSVEAQVGN